MLIETSVYGICLLIFIAQIFLARYELISNFYIKGIQQRGDWVIQHDERMCLSDARYWYLKNKGADVHLRDYLPYQISASFGVFTPAVIYFGFRLFGMNNLGLRVFTIALMSLSNLFLVSMILKTVSPYLALLGCLVFVINWNNFILSRHPTPESLFVFFINAFFYVVICHWDFYNSHWALVSFLAGATILLKINFPIQFYCLFFTLNLFVFDFMTLFISTLCYVMGILFFEAIQFCILKKLGTVKDRYLNIFMVSNVHSGKKVVWDNPGLYLRHTILLVFTNLFLEWFGLPSGGYNLNKRAGLFYLLLIMSLITTQVIILKGQGHILTLLPIGIALFSLIISSFHFSFKRFISVFPLTLLVFLATVDIVIKRFAQYSIFVEFLLTSIAIFVIIYQLKQACTFIKHRSLGLQKIVSDIEERLPSSAHIYCHLFAFRAIWQVKKQRVFTCDDNVMRN